MIDFAVGEGLVPSFCVRNDRVGAPLRAEWEHLLQGGVMTPPQRVEKPCHSEPVLHSDALRAAFGGCALHAPAGAVAWESPGFSNIFC